MNLSLPLPAHGFACPCGRVVLDLRGAPAGANLACPRCGREFASRGEALAPETTAGPAETARAHRAAHAAAGGAKAELPPPPPSAARLTARYVILWTLCVSAAFLGYILYKVRTKEARIAWDRLPWWAWLAAIAGAALLGLALWAAHVYFFVHQERRPAGRARGRLSARRRDAAPD